MVRWGVGQGSGRDAKKEAEIHGVSDEDKLMSVS